MRTRSAAAAGLVSLFMLVRPAPALAWGTAAHRYIMARAIDLLPPPLKTFFDHSRDELVLRSVDPDMWRTAGFDEDSNHFLDLGVEEYGPYPFAALPREYGAAVEMFGLQRLKRNGLLPWRAAEEFGNLQRAFESFAHHVPYASSDAILFAAALGHYIQDAHQPLHATNNYDGQMTGQNGVHARFESDLFERYEARLRVVPRPAMPITNPRDFCFDVLLASFQLVPALLEADREAVAGKDFYDDEYFDRFFEQARPLLERRLAESISATASVIVGAWEAAGKPALATSVPRTPQKVVRPRLPPS